MVSRAEKIWAELISKADYLWKSLKFENDDEKELPKKAFDMFFKEWQEKTEAKWWIDHLLRRHQALPPIFHYFRLSYCFREQYGIPLSVHYRKKLKNSRYPNVATLTVS